MHTLDYYKKNREASKKHIDKELCKFLSHTRNIDAIGLFISSFIIDLYPDFILTHVVPPSQHYNVYELDFIDSLAHYMEVRAAEITTGLLLSGVADL